MKPLLGCLCFKCRELRELAERGTDMRPFDTKEEAYNAGFGDAADGAKEMEQAMKEEAYNDGYNQGGDQGEQQRHELEVEVDGLRALIHEMHNPSMPDVPGLHRVAKMMEEPSDPATCTWEICLKAHGKPPRPLTRWAKKEG